jgi:uncharacterized protein
MSNGISRRHFLGTAMAGAVAAKAADVGATNALPTRVLGRTGATPSILAFGCGSRLLSYKEEDKGIEAIDLAIRSGITYIDTAQAYGNGVSETWVGKALKGRRDGLFLATKTPARTAEDAFRAFEESLKRLQTDHVDLLHIHSLENEEDLAKIESKGGVLEAVYKLRDQKAARFIGITCHADPVALKKALEHNDFDCTQMALNAALQGMQNGKGKMIINPALTSSFEHEALPVAKKKNMGVLAMKVFGQEDLMPDPNDTELVQRLLRYAWSLPVSVAVAGMPQLEFVRQNTAWARSFEPMPADEMKDFSQKMAQKYKMALDLKFSNHVDA